MIYKGSQKVTNIGINVKIDIKSDAGFTVYGLDVEGNRLHLLGPFADRAKRLATVLPLDCDGIELKTSANTMWELKVTELPRRYEGNPVPVAVTLEHEKPMSLKQEIAQYFSQMMDVMEQQKDHEKPEDIFNFEDDEEGNPYDTDFTIPDDIDIQLREFLNPPDHTPAKPDQTVKEAPTDDVAVTTTDIKESDKNPPHTPPQSPQPDA